MHLIIGGAYQGKLAFARKLHGFSEEQIFSCTPEDIDFRFPCICGIEEYVWGCIRRGEDPTALFRAHRDSWESSVLILGDISGGIVPMDREERLWREKTGKLCQYLSGEADRVSRIFCGLEDRLK